MRYFAYVRKSTEDDDRQVLSIEAQLHELKEFAAKEKLEIVASFQESKTAKEPGRMVFGQMLEKIEKGKAEGIISWHPDRLARNSVDGGKIIHLVDQGKIKSLKFPTHWFEPTPQGLFMLQIAFGQSKYYVDNLRENVIRGMNQKIRNGVWPCWAPLGFLNNPKTRGIDVDVKKAPFIKQLFELYATGSYNLREIAEWCNKVGLKSNKEKPICLNHVHQILQNIFYTGLMKYNSEIFESTHLPLISKKLFDKVQEVLKQRGRPQKVKRHNFAFLGFLKCGSCGASITAELQKGHHYYRCTKKKGLCQEKHYLREESLIEQTRVLLQKVSLSSQDCEKVLFELEKDNSKAKEQAKECVQNLKLKLTMIEQKLEKLLDVYLGEIITTEEYTLRKQKLLSKKMEIQEKINDFEQNGLSWLEPAREFIFNLGKAWKLKKSDNYSEISNFLKNIGSNQILQNGQLLFSLSDPYKLLAEQGKASSQKLTFNKWWT